MEKRDGSLPCCLNEPYPGFAVILISYEVSELSDPFSTIQQIVTGHQLCSFAIYGNI